MLQNQAPSFIIKDSQLRLVLNPKRLLSDYISEHLEFIFVNKCIKLTSALIQKQWNRTFFFSFFGKSEDFLENPVKVNVVNQISGCDNAEKEKILQP